MFKFENGQKVEDKVTRFIGTVTERTDYITGCNRYGVESLDETFSITTAYFDEDRLESDD